MSLINVLLPLPDTPVTATKHPKGIFTFKFFRLCSRAPLIERNSLLGSRRITGISTDRLPDRYWPVIDSATFKTPPTAPLYTT